MKYRDLLKKKNNNEDSQSTNSVESSSTALDDNENRNRTMRNTLSQSERPNNKSFLEYLRSQEAVGQEEAEQTETAQIASGTDIMSRYYTSAQTALKNSQNEMGRNTFDSLKNKVNNIAKYYSGTDKLSDDMQSAYQTLKNNGYDNLEDASKHLLDEDFPKEAMTAYKYITSELGKSSDEKLSTDTLGALAKQYVNRHGYTDETTDYQNFISDVENAEQEYKSNAKKIQDAVSDFDTEEEYKSAVAQAEEDAKTSDDLQKEYDKKKAEYDSTWGDFNKEYAEIGGSYNNNPFTTQGKNANKKLQERTNQRTELDNLQRKIDQKKELEAEKKYYDDFTKQHPEDAKIVSDYYDSKHEGYQTDWVGLNKGFPTKGTNQELFREDMERRKNGDYSYSPVYYSDEEKTKREQAFNALADKGYDTDTLYKYYERAKDREKATDELKKVAEASKRNPVGATASAVFDMIPASFETATEEIGAVADKWTGGDGYYNPQESDVYGLNTMTSTVADTIENPFAKLAYQQGISLADNAIRMGIAYANPAIGMPIMGVEVGSQAFNDVVENGGSVEQALATALTYAGVEVLTENVSLSKLKGFKRGSLKATKDILKNVGKQIVTEAGEEVSATLLDSIADEVINGNLSQLETEYNDYIKSGMSEEDARQALISNYAGQLAQDAIGGALMGGISGTAFNTSQYRRNIKAGKSISSLDNIDTVKNLAKHYGLNDSVTDYESNPTDARLGALRSEAYEKATESMPSEKEFKKVIKKANLASDEKVVANKLTNGENLTDDDLEKIKKSENLKSLLANDVVNQAKTARFNQQTALLSADTKLFTPSLIEFDSEKSDADANLNKAETLDKFLTKNAKNMTINTDTVDKMKDAYNGLEDKIEPDTFAMEYARFYNQGVRAVAFKSLNSTVSQLPYNVQVSAYEDGLNKYTTAFKAGNALSKLQQEWKEKTNGYAKGTVDTSALEGIKLNDEQKASVDYISGYANHGLNVKFYASRTDENGVYIDDNGGYDSLTNTIMIDINAKKETINDVISKGAMMSTFGHELSHLAEHAPTEYAELSKAIQDAVGADVFNDAVDKHYSILEERNSDKWQKMSDDKRQIYATREAVAEFSSDLVNKAKILEKMSKENPSVGKKFINLIKKVISKIKSILKDNRGMTDEARLLANNLASNAEKLQSIVDKYEKAVVEGLKNQNAKIYAKKSSTESNNSIEENNTEIQNSTRSGDFLSDKEANNQYSQAVKNNDIETAQKLVDEKAMSWGAYSEEGKTPIKLYHGTQSFGFTEFALDKMDDGRSIFLTDSKEIASTYSGVDDVRKISERINIDVDKLTSDKTVELLNKYSEKYNYKYYSESEVEKLKSDNNSRYGRRLSRDNISGDIIVSQSKKTPVFYLSSIDSSKELLKIYVGKGNYSLYAKLNNPYVVECDGSYYNDITYYEVLPDELKKFYPSGLWRTGTTRDVAEYAKDNGYDSVIFKNLNDKGGKNSKIPRDTIANVYVVFNQNNVKSADAITYDNNGKVIPLSERFNSNQEDIRYNMRGGDFLSNREALAQALETTTINASERNTVKTYQQGLEQMNKLNDKLNEIDDKIKTINAKDNISKSDKAEIASLKKVKAETEEKIVNKDKSLLKLESTEAMRNILQYETSKKIAGVREQKNERIAEIRKQETQKRKDAVAKLRKQKNDKIDDIILKNREKRKADAEKRKDNQDWSHSISEIKKYSKKLLDAVLHPTEKMYIPYGLNEPIKSITSTLLDSINLDNDTKMSDNLRKLSQQLEQVNQSDEHYGDFYNAYNEEIIEEIKGFADYLDDRLEGVKIKKQTQGESLIEGLTHEEAKEIEQIVKDVYHATRDAVKQIGRQDAITNYESGLRIINQTRKLGDVKLNVMDSLLDQVLSPMRLMAKYTGYNADAELMYHINALNEGTEKYNMFKMLAEKPLNDFIKENPKEYENFKNDVIEIKYRDNKNVAQTVKITKSQGLQILMSWTREHTEDSHLDHLERGGVTLLDAEQISKGNYEKAFAQRKTIRGINLSFISAVQSQMGDFENHYRELAETLFNEVSNAYINDTSAILLHRDIATEKYYIPFAVNKDFLSTEIDGLKYDATIVNKGMLKATKRNAPQALNIAGLDSVISKHIRDVGQYYGYAVPIRNLNKALNVKMFDTNENGNKIATDSVRNSLRETFNSDKPIQFIEQVMTDLQTSRKSNSQTEKAINKIVRAVRDNMITSALKGSVSVVIKQGASLYTASSILSMRSVSVGAVKGIQQIAHKGGWKQLTDEIDAHTAGHYMRRIGLSSMEIEAMKDSWLGKKLPTALNPAKWIQGTDCITTALHWVATKEEVSRLYKEQGKADQIGSDEYFDEVTKLYDKILEETQPMYDSLHRGEIQKNSNELLKSVFMFKTQPLQNTGILYDAIMDYQSNKDNAELRDVKKQKLAKAVSSQMLSALTFVAMTFIASLALHKPERYKDENDEVTLSSVLERLGIDWAETGFSVLVPIGGAELASFIENQINGKDYDFASDNVVSMLNDFTSSIGDFNQNVIVALAQGNFDLDKAKDALWGLSVDGLAFFKGFPLKNYSNIVNGIFSNLSDAISGHSTYFGSSGGRKGSEYANSYDVLIDNNPEKAKQQLETFYNEKYEEQIAKGETTTEAKKKAQTSVRTALTTQYKKEYQRAFLNNDRDKMQKISKKLQKSGYMKWDGKSLSTVLGEWTKSAQENLSK
nr:MAG TPA: hypothetical protein [Bacteriophage sp.]